MYAKNCLFRKWKYDIYNFWISNCLHGIWSDKMALGLVKSAHVSFLETYISFETSASASAQR